MNANGWNFASAGMARRSILSKKNPNQAKKESSYFHIQACPPNGVAEADGGFAERVLNFIVKRATIKPAGSLEFPTDWTKENWEPGEIALKASKPYTVQA